MDSLVEATMEVATHQSTGDQFIGDRGSWLTAQVSGIPSGELTVCYGKWP